MTDPRFHNVAPKPDRPGFQFSLRTLLLLFVVLGSSLAVFGAWGIVVFGCVGWSCLHRAYCSSAVVLFSSACLISLFCAALPVIVAPRATGVVPNNLYQITLALESYHQTNGRFPPAYIADKNGKPMYSWRVLILPFLDSTIFTRLTISTNRGTDRTTRNCLHDANPELCLPERSPNLYVRRGPDKLRCRVGTERQIGPY